MLIDDINRNRELEKSVAGKPIYRVSVLANIILNQVKDPLEIQLRENGINAHVTFADYDNFVQESSRCKESEAVLLFWEACALIKGLPYKCLLWTPEETETFLEKVTSEISLVLQQLQDVPLVLFNEFSTSLFNYPAGRKNNFDYVCTRLNTFISEIKQRNLHILPINQLIAPSGLSQVFNKRMWYSSSMLYTYDFLCAYAIYSASYMLSISGKSRKALVLDCDNTLWKGIVGEDGPNGIAYHENQKDGVYFEEIHYLIKSLSKNGILLALNSKNNEADVKQVFDENDKTPLRWDDFIVTRVNWNNKADNLRDIAKMLNIGLDSLVHIDDSDFEINHIRSELPQVYTIQVPQQIKDYPSHFKKHLGLFLNLNQTEEDLRRTEMYKADIIRQESQSAFSNMDEYLRSLGLELTIWTNNPLQVERIAQMTQKTNQFNLTTTRYSDTEIIQFLEDGLHDIFSFSLKDKFGDYGITGLCMLDYRDPEAARVDTFLMSCRIIGRNVEFAFFNFMVNWLLQKKIKQIRGAYIKTFKNSQVADLYDRLGFSLVAATENQKDYILQPQNAQTFDTSYIKIHYEGKN